MSPPDHLRAELAPLVAAMEVINEQIAQADSRLGAEVKADPVAKRLMTVPGGGPVTAATFVAVVDRVERFETARELRSPVAKLSANRRLTNYCVLQQLTDFDKPERTTQTTFSVDRQRRFTEASTGYFVCDVGICARSASVARDRETQTANHR